MLFRGTTGDLLIEFLRNLKIVLFAYLYTVPYPVADDILGESLCPVRFGVFSQGVAPFVPRLQPHSPTE